MGTRRYSLGKRAEGMAETRRRVIAAARELFLETGFEKMSIDEVAERAGVGRTTVFQQFESKTGLLRAVESDVDERAGVGGLLQELEHPDARDALRAAFEVGCKVWEAEHPMFRKLFRLGVVDAELGQVMAQKEEIRRELCNSLVGRLAKQGDLRPGWTKPRASAVLWLLTSFETFDQLYRERGSAKEVSELLIELARTFANLVEA